MTYQASHRFARISPRKARLIADLVRGQGIEDAMAALDFSKRRGAYYLRNVLKSAIANAEEKDADVTTLFVESTWVDEGPTIKRFQPKDRGRAHPIRKRTSHIHVQLSER
jgi:large subunit ribosomal protein L22